MKSIALYLFLSLLAQPKQVQFDNDLVHISMSFVRAESIEEMSMVSSKIARIDAENQIKDGNEEDLRIFKKEIDRLMLIDPKLKQELVGLNNKFRAAAFTMPNGHREFSEKYETLLVLEKQISQIVGRQNAISWIYKIAVLDMEGRLLRSQVTQAEILETIDGYEKKYGKHSLFLADLYWNLNRKLTKSGDYKSALAIYEKTKEMAVKYTSKKSRRVYSVEIGAVKCYVELGESKKAQDIVSSLNVFELYSICDGMFYELYIFNSSASTLSANKNKLEDAILFQEGALVYLENVVDKADPNLTGEANKLRDLFVKKGDWISAGKVEDKYKLKPIPKKSGEG